MIEVFWRQIEGRCTGNMKRRCSNRSDLFMIANTPGTGGSPVVMHEVCTGCAADLKTNYGYQEPTT